MNSIWFVTILIAFFQVKHSSALCGYESCPKAKPGHLNVHLVTHSHDDAGWLKTVDQYFYGDKNSIQRAAVQYILDSVVDELQKDPNRRFIYVESAFFWRWWTNQDDKIKDIVRKLVNNGQLEFIGGGWVMNDEAGAHYSAIVDQMALGLRYLNDTFGECAIPRVAWQIDPFGHSREQASLFAQMGFDGLFFGRLDYQDKYNRRFNKEMESIWVTSPKNLGTDSWLFTGVLYNNYQQPDGFCFDILCNDEPIHDDKKLAGYNLETRIRDFSRAALEWAIPYRTNNILMTMWSDFHYTYAGSWYKNLDKIIKHINAKQDHPDKDTFGMPLNVFYSTPSCYVQEVNKAKLEYSVKTDDFFPYASDPHAYWTGYFTSRPTLKYFIQYSNTFLQSCIQLAVASNNGQAPDSVVEDVFQLAEPVAVNQHHDAVTGTAKQHVTNDYYARLSKGLLSCDKIVGEAFRTIEKSEPLIQMDFCHLRNISVCKMSEGTDDMVVTVYNSLARDLNESYVRIPITKLNGYIVEGPQGIIAPQTVEIPESILNLPGRKSVAKYELVFPTGVLPALSHSNYLIQRPVLRDPLLGSSFIIDDEQLSSVRVGRDIKENVRVYNAMGLSVVFSETGLLKSITRAGETVQISQNFYYYQGMKGRNMGFSDRASGAYIFRPNGSEPIPIADKAEFKIVEGQHVVEIHQKFSNWVSQVVRVYDTSDAVEFEWLVGPIPVESDHIGKEIITRYTSDLNNKGNFYTDANGRELLKRTRDYRPTWSYKVYEPVAGNYFPVNSRILITEGADLSLNEKTLMVLNDRAQGGTSQRDGTIELMLHRRLLYDDAFGVEEALNERAFGFGLVARGKHWLVLAGGKSGVPVSIHRELGQEIFMNKIVGLRPSKDFGENVPIGSFETKFSKLSKVLPENIHLLTLEPLADKKFMIRLEHFYEQGEDPEMSKPVSISVKKLMEVIPEITSIREATLGGNIWKDELKRFEWKADPSKLAGINNNVPKQSNSDISEVIEMRPMEIRTFICFT